MDSNLEMGSNLKMDSRNLEIDSWKLVKQIVCVVILKNHNIGSQKSTFASH